MRSWRRRGHASSDAAIIINPNQKGNPIISAGIRNVPWEYGEIPCDYQVGASTGVLFLRCVGVLHGSTMPTALIGPTHSIRYHRLHPDYIDKRIVKLQGLYSIRILLVMCDVDDSQDTVKFLTKLAIVNDLTMMVAWSCVAAMNIPSAAPLRVSSLA